jgi:hypothetical protein
MAVTFKVLTIVPDTETLGGTATRPVYAVTFRTDAHGVVATINAPRANFTPEVANEYALALATGIEELFGEPAVADVAWSQEVTPAGQLTPHLTIYVTSTSGNSTGTVEVNYPPFNAPAFMQSAKDLRAQFDATEALTG